MEEPVMNAAEPDEALEEGPSPADAAARIIAAQQGKASPESVGLGVDIVSIERMERVLARTPRFAERVFTEAERAYCKKSAHPATHYACRFAAKEAVLKALGTGFAGGIGPLDVEVVRQSSGRPQVRLHGAAKQVAADQGVRDLPVSLSFTHTDAVACALAITEGSVRAAVERTNPTEELARQFKETRALLDELPVAGVRAQRPAGDSESAPDAQENSTYRSSGEATAVE